MTLLNMLQRPAPRHRHIALGSLATAVELTILLAMKRYSQALPQLLVRCQFQMPGRQKDFHDFSTTPENRGVLAQRQKADQN